MSTEEIVHQATRSGRMDVAIALVTAIYGQWHQHPPYTDLAQEIVDDPDVGVKMALEEFVSRAARGD